MTMIRCLLCKYPMPMKDKPLSGTTDVVESEGACRYCGTEYKIRIEAVKKPVGGKKVVPNFVE